MNDIKKCLVCMYSYNRVKNMNICPVCGFQEPYIMSDYEEGNKELKAMIEQKKSELTDRLQIGIKTYMYEINANSIVESGELVSSFNPIRSDENVCWLNDSFETVSTREMLEAEVLVKLDKTTYSLKMKLPNIKESKSLQVGIAMDDQFCLRLTVRDQDNHMTRSEKMYIFDRS